MEGLVPSLFLIQEQDIVYQHMHYMCYIISKQRFHVCVVRMQVMRCTMHLPIKIPSMMVPHCAASIVQSTHTHTAVHDMYMIGNLRLVPTRLDKILVKY